MAPVGSRSTGSADASVVGTVLFAVSLALIIVPFRIVARGEDASGRDWARFLGEAMTRPGHRLIVLCHKNPSPASPLAADM